MESQDNIQAELDKHKENFQLINPVPQISLNNKLDAFNLNSLLNIRSTSRFYKFVVDTTAIIREKLSSMVLTSQSLVKPLTDLQKTHLASKLVQLRIQQNKITIGEAIQHTATAHLPNPNRPAHFTSAVRLGLTPFEAQHAWVTDTHIEALNAGLSFDEIFGLTKNQVLAILVTRPAPITTAANETIVITSPIMPKTLTRKDVEGVSLKDAHIEALKKGWDLDKIISLSDLQLNALFIGFTEDDIQQKWLSQEHINVVKNDKLKIETTRELTSFQLQAMQYGISLSDVKEVSIGARHITALGTGISFRNIKDLTEKQLLLMTLGCTLEQTKNPFTVKMIETLGNNFEYTISQLFQRGYKIEQIVNLSPAQCELLTRYGCTFEQITNPLIVKMIQELGYNCEHTIGPLFQKGYKIEQIADLSRSQYNLISSYRCTFEQATNPIIVKMIQAAGKHGEHPIGTLLQKGYKIEQIADLSRSQLNLISQYGFTLDQVTNPKLVELINKNKNLGYAISQMLEKGYKLEQLVELTPLQLQAINMPCELTLEQVKHPNFSEKLVDSIYDLYELGYDFDTIIDLQPWQLELLRSKVPLEEVVKRNENLTPIHLLALVMPGIISYNDVKDLKPQEVLTMLMTPFVKLQPAPHAAANNDTSPLLFSGASTLKSTKDTSSDDELTKTKDSSPHIGFDCV